MQPVISSKFSVVHTINLIYKFRPYCFLFYSTTATDCTVQRSYYEICIFKPLYWLVAWNYISAWTSRLGRIRERDLVLLNYTKLALCCVGSASNEKILSGVRFFLSYRLFSVFILECGCF